MGDVKPNAVSVVEEVIGDGVTLVIRFFVADFDEDLVVRRSVVVVEIDNAVVVLLLVIVCFFLLAIADSIVDVVIFLFFFVSFKDWGLLLLLLLLLLQLRVLRRGHFEKEISSFLSSFCAWLFSSVTGEESVEVIRRRRLRPLDRSSDEAIISLSCTASSKF